ncbi:hypothetical protein QBC47DRAFT_378749 [Echria macrotheca]|uniref:Uncharacterized protein n=1 Tax=Echria macrotheca TaxID=438768 RepID=A0AAJ0F6U3_9PEZI|nr:hypothetical protein QBC47DRAFT_378749 [Echria macrotheca]
MVVKGGGGGEDGYVKGGDDVGNNEEGGEDNGRGEIAERQDDRPDRARIAYICNGVPDERCCRASDDSDGDDHTTTTAPVGSNNSCSPATGAGSGAGIISAGRRTEGGHLEEEGEKGGVEERTGLSPAVDEMHCDEAVSILTELQKGRGMADAAAARSMLGCEGTRECVVKNTRLFQVMDEMS